MILYRLPLLRRFKHLFKFASVNFFLMLTMFCQVPRLYAATNSTLALKKIPSKHSKKNNSSKPIDKITLKSIRHQSLLYKGLFKVYQTLKEGELYMVLYPSNLNKNFIYTTYIENAPTLAQQFRGRYLEDFIFRLSRSYDHIQWSRQNTSFYFDPKLKLSKASEANISPAVFYSSKIIDENKKTGAILIKCSDLFLSEFFQKLKPAQDKPKKDFHLGRIEATKSQIIKITSYPKNLNVLSSYVFQNLNAPNLDNTFTGITDPRFVTVKLRHIISAIPKNNYKSRAYHPSVGYFSTQQNNMTTFDHNYFKDNIQRWHLEKKDPLAKLSFPKKPIVWWIENTTPISLRPYIKQGVLAWNTAFEKAGFKQALVVKEQPDNANWDAGDIRYNVIRWTSSPNPPFGGYGPSVVNPLTGEIIGADIMLEWVFLTNRQRYKELYTLESSTQCLYQNHSQDQFQFGNLTVHSSLKQTVLQEALINLVMHEIGHTLGLTHNFMASRLLSPKQLNDVTLSKKKGLYASVMDYSPINISPNPSLQGQFYSTTPGPYDIWAIQYGYSINQDNLEDILSQSGKPELAYGNDADDMRSNGKGVDPRIMVGDLSSQPIVYASRQLEHLQLIGKSLLDSSNPTTFDSLAYVNKTKLLLRQYHTHLKVISRFIGGIYLEQQIGKNSDSLLAVSRDDQLRALHYLDTFLFNAHAFNFLNETFNKLKIERRGFDLYNKNPYLSPEKLIEPIQKDIINHLLHPKLLKRFEDQKFYKGELTLLEYLEALTRVIFNDSIFSKSNTFKKSLQRLYVSKSLSLLKSSSENSNYNPALLYNIKEIKKHNRLYVFLNKEKKTHRQYILNQLEQFK